jgi:uncharacterized protein YdaU (DUF1376 family)
MVRLMTLEQRGAYHEMLCVSWQIGPLPDDHSLLSRLLGIDIETFERVWVSPLSECWEKTELGLVNERLEKERRWAENRQEKARKAADAKWQRMRAQSASNAKDEDMGEHMHRRSHPDPDPDPEPEKKKEKSGIASQPARLVSWHPPPTWKKGDPSLEKTQLIFEAGFLEGLKQDYQRISVDGEIVKLENYARANPSWARSKKDWRKTLTNWLNRADERFDDARFKNARASPSPDAMGLTGEHESTDYTEEIAACESANGAAIHSVENLITSGERSKMRWCQFQCGFSERKT